MEIRANPLGKRFRGYLPVVVDIETAGFNAKRNPLLEIAIVIVEPDDQGRLEITERYAHNIEPFRGSELDESALKFTGIDPYHPFRLAVDEKTALKNLFKPIRDAIKRNDCNRAILVGHNPSFDMNFLNAAITRCKIKRSPFHPFSTFDTATLGGLIFGQTVLAKIAKAADLDWDNDKAHSAIYDAEQTARLFCLMVNKWQSMESGKTSAFETASSSESSE